MGFIANLDYIWPRWACFCRSIHLCGCKKHNQETESTQKEDVKNSPGAKPGLHENRVLSGGGVMSVPKVPYNQRLCISIEEAADYSMIGEQRLRRIIEDDVSLEWVLKVGNRTRIKRPQFEKWVLQQYNL